MCFRDLPPRSLSLTSYVPPAACAGGPELTSSPPPATGSRWHQASACTNQAPPWPKDHNRAANHHLLSRLRRLSRVQSGPAAAVAGASIPAHQHRAARPPHRQVASGAAGKASGHRPGQPCQVASMCVSVRWRGTHLHAASRSLRFRCGGVGSQRPVRH